MNFTAPIDDALSLRLVEPRHAEELYEVIDANRAHLERWLPWATITTNPEPVREFASRSLAAFVESNALNLSILEHGRIVGGIGLDRVQRRDDGIEMASGDIGYWLIESAQGRGIMTRAARPVIEHGFTAMRLLRITIRAEPDNPRSWAIPERLGFHYEGTLRGICRFAGRRVDHRLYAMLAEEWSAQA